MECWQYFHITSVNNDWQQYLSCNKWKKLLAFSSFYVPNNLRTHVNSCLKIDKSPSVSKNIVHDFYSSSTQSPVPNEVKSSITEACTEFCTFNSLHINFHEKFVSLFTN
jgi:hypothetical protein